MKAARINLWQEPVQIEELPQPKPAADEVLVKVHAASVNPIDRLINAGYLKDMVSVPLTPGTDFSGEVAAAGAEAGSFKPGDAVYGATLGRGTFAEYVLVKASSLALKPRSLDDIQAAAVPLTGLTAWQTLFNIAKLQKGERLLIHGAGGGVGSFAVQLAKDKGAFVIGHDLPAKADFIKKLGADEFISASGQPFEELAGKVDVVLDLVGGELVERSFKVLKPGGRFVTTIGQLAPDAGKEEGIIVSGTFTQPNSEELSKLAELIDAGKLKVSVSRTFPLEEAQSALDYIPKDGTQGKVVITLL